MFLHTFRSEKFIRLALHNSKVSSEMKVKMVKLLLKKETLRRITDETTVVQNIQICYFVSKNTLKLFTVLDIPQDF